MITRVSQLRIDPARADQAERVVREQLAPAVLAQPGAVAGRWMIDPGSGEVLTTVRWADGDAMFAAGAALAAIRDQTAAELRATPVSLQVHEVIGVAVARPLALEHTAWSNVVLLDGVDESHRADAAALFRILAEEHDGKPGYLGTSWTADFTTSTSVIVATWATLDALDADAPTTTAVVAEVERALSARIASSSKRRTVGSFPADHVVDLTPFDRVASHLTR